MCEGLKMCLRAGDAGKDYGTVCRVMEQSKNSSVQHNCVETNW